MEFHQTHSNLQDEYLHLYNENLRARGQCYEELFPFVILNNAMGLVYVHIFL